MSLDPPFEPPPAIPGWAQDLYDWMALVQDQVDTHSAQIARNTAVVNQLKGKLMATQADVDAIVTELNAATDEILAKIAELEAREPQLDLSALKASADRLRDVVPDAPAEPTA